MEDIKIIELFNLRDEQAISETDIKYGRSCRRMARDILSDREEAEECVDDTYLAQWESTIDINDIVALEIMGQRIELD